VGFDCELYEAQLAQGGGSSGAASKSTQFNQQLSKLRSVGELDVEQRRPRQRRPTPKLRTFGDSESLSSHRSVTGRIARRIAAQYEYVPAGKPLLQIVDGENLELKMNVPSAWLTWLRWARHCRFILMT